LFFLKTRWLSALWSLHYPHIHSLLIFRSSSVLTNLYSFPFLISNAHLPSLFLSSSQIFEMENALENLKRTYPNMPRDVLKLIYRYHLERSRVLIKSRLPRDLQEIIVARVHLVSELPSLFVKHLPGMEKSSYSKKRRAKRIKVCHKCARWNCDTGCRNPGFVSKNWEDKIRCIKNELSKESLDDIY